MDPPDEPEETGIDELLGAEALTGPLFGTDAKMGTWFWADTL